MTFYSWPFSSGASSQPKYTCYPPFVPVPCWMNLHSSWTVPPRTSSKYDISPGWETQPWHISHYLPIIHGTFTHRPSQRRVAHCLRALSLRGTPILSYQWITQLSGMDDRPSNNLPWTHEGRGLGRQYWIRKSRPAIQGWQPSIPCVGTIWVHIQAFHVLINDGDPVLVESPVYAYVQSLFVSS